MRSACAACHAENAKIATASFPKHRAKTVGLSMKPFTSSAAVMSRMASNDEVERRAIASTPNEADLSLSSTSSFANQRHDPAIARTDCWMSAPLLVHGGDVKPNYNVCFVGCFNCQDIVLLAMLQRRQGLSKHLGAWIGMRDPCVLRSHPSNLGRREENYCLLFG